VGGAVGSAVRAIRSAKRACEATLRSGRRVLTWGSVPEMVDIVASGQID
jgi:hypothetical protein